MDEHSLKNELQQMFSEKKSNFDKIVKKKLVLSGGGVKGIAHIGALKALSDYGILQNIDTFAGTSIGALTVALLVIGYSPDALNKFIMEFDFGKAKGLNFDNMLLIFGLNDGKKFQLVIEKFFAAKNLDINITFAQLFQKTKKTLYITAVCLNTKKVHYYSHITSPDMSVILAIRMSIAIPIYFSPVKYKGEMFIDGGCMDNYPIQLFSNNLSEVIGLYVSEIRDTINEINNLEDYLLHTIECLLEGVTYNSLRKYEKYSIKIHVEKINVVDFHVDKINKQKLFQAGYDAVLNHIKS